MQEGSTGSFWEGGGKSGRDGEKVREKERKRKSEAEKE